MSSKITFFIFQISAASLKGQIYNKEIPLNNTIWKITIFNCCMSHNNDNSIFFSERYSSVSNYGLCTSLSFFSHVMIMGLSKECIKATQHEDISPCHTSQWISIWWSISLFCDALTSNLIFLWNYNANVVIFGSHWKFCTCHDSHAVVTCAKFHWDPITIIWLKSWWYLLRFE